MTRPTPGGGGPVPQETALAPWAGPRVFTALAAASGFCALGYEVLYLRHLTVLLGDMLYVHAALLAAFLVGVGVGAQLAHRFHGSLALFEAATGLYALGLPQITAWMGGQRWMAAVTGSPALSVGVTAGLVLVPGLLVGFSMPLFSAYLRRGRRGRGLAFQGVYTAYNLGAFLGIAAVELLLVRLLGIRLSLATLAAVNLVVAGVLLAAGTRAVTSPAVPARRFGRRVVTAVFVASLASAVFQMFFLKLTYLVFTPHRENFALAVGVGLLGISLGSWWASRSGVRVQTALLLVPLSLGVVFLAHPLLADLFLATYGQVGVTPWGARLARGGFAAVYGLLPAMAFGALLPALMREEGAVAAESGRLLLVSSLANAAGYLLFVTVLHPLLDGSGVLVVVAAGAAAGAVILEPRSLRAVERGLAAVGGVLALALLLTWNDADLYLASTRFFLQDETRVSTFKSGGESATLVEDPGERWISYNGFPSIVVDRGGVVNHAEVVSGIVPALAAPRLERALVLGMGTGITAGTAAQLFAAVDVVEINAAFLQMAPELQGATFGLDRNPRARIHITDGRAFLVGKEGVYDAVVNSIPAPTYYSAGKIYTVEFYETVRRALKPDGVFATWLSTENMTRQGLETVLQTLSRVWRWCDLRPLRSNYYMATCGAAPPTARPASALDLPPAVAEALEAGVGGFEAEGYLDDLLVSRDLLGKLQGTAAVNTDDRPVLEYQVLDLLLATPPDPDHLKRDPDRFGIDPTADLSEPDAIVRKAATLRWVDPLWFDGWFLPLFQEDPALQEAWTRYETGVGGGA